MHRRSPPRCAPASRQRASRSGPPSRPPTGDRAAFPMNRLEDGSRYSFGADEFVFVELSEEMSLETTLRVVAITDELRSGDLPGLLDICPAHVSYMLRVDPEVLDPREVIGLLGDLHRKRGDSSHLKVHARLIELPVFYDDPWTRET